MATWIFTAAAGGFRFREWNLVFITVPRINPFVMRHTQAMASRCYLRGTVGIWEVKAEPKAIGTIPKRSATVFTTMNHPFDKMENSFWADSLFCFVKAEDTYQICVPEWA